MQVQRATKQRPIRSGDIVFQRVGFPEGDVFSHPFVFGFIVDRCADLARRNGISRAIDPRTRAPLEADYGDLLATFSLTTIESLRQIAEVAPQPIIDEFRQHMAAGGTSMIWQRIMRHGQTAAIRYLCQRSRRCEIPVDFHQPPPEFLPDIDAAATAPAEPAPPPIEDFLERLPPLSAEAIRLKFGLNGPAMTFSQIADEFNRRELKYLGRYRWTRNLSSLFVRDALQQLREMEGIDELWRN